jgi:hypothetical protein
LFILYFSNDPLDTYFYFTIYILFDSHLLIPSTLLYQKLFHILAVLIYSSFNTFSRKFVWFTGVILIFFYMNYILYDLYLLQLYLKFPRIFFSVVYFVFGICKIINVKILMFQLLYYLIFFCSSIIFKTFIFYILFFCILQACFRFFVFFFLTSFCYFIRFFICFFSQYYFILFLFFLHFFNRFHFTFLVLPSPFFS